MGFVLANVHGRPIIIPLDNIAGVGPSDKDDPLATVYFKKHIETKEVILYSIVVDCTVPEFMVLIQQATNTQVTTINKLTVNRIGDVSEAVATGLEHRGG